MNQIQHLGKYFILPRQGRETPGISETQLLECLEILKTEIEKEVGQEITWQTVIETLSDTNEGTG